jgi:hypothetical protein
MKELCSLERKPFTLNDTHYEYIKGCWRARLSKWYEAQGVQRQGIPNGMFQEAAPRTAAPTTALIPRPPVGAVRFANGGQQIAHREGYFSPELEIMAGILAYFEISIIRTSDHVTMAIEEKLVQKMATEIKKNLVARLGLQGEEGKYFAQRYGTDSDATMERRDQLIKRRDLLSKAMEELKEVERGTRDL